MTPFYGEKKYFEKKIQTYRDEYDKTHWKKNIKKNVYGKD